VKFVDTAQIECRAGKGGAGSRHFRREAMVQYGGPDGGNGGKGGSVILIADKNKHTLLDFSFQPKWKAQDGGGGEGGRRSGKNGEDLKILIPVGTEIFNSETQELVCDLVEDGQEFILCKGGRGGKGNDFFKSATNRAPEHAQPGEEGEFGTYTLSLKLMADVGLVGFPNAGKSTLISRISAARPKIADYPFTTLTPNLGVVQGKGGFSFVVADIPGLIPGASEGKGLGIHFLKHIERTRVITHLIDIEGLNELGEPINVVDSYDSIRTELQNFSEELANRPTIVVFSKADISQDKEKIQEAQRAFEERGIKTLVISSASGEGIQELIDTLTKLLQVT
jgi:GTP-binding protein